MFGSERGCVRIYLNDHWAGAGAGVALAKRMARHSRKSAWGERLQSLASAVESDERTFEALRSAMGVSGGSIKRLLAQLAERMSALKPNGGTFWYSPLSRVLESEAMLAGVSAKQRLWASLRACCSEDSRIAGFDLEEMERRAQEQLGTLRDFHEEAARRAFGGNRTN